MLTLSTAESPVLIEEHTDKDLDIITLLDLSFVDWDSVIASFKKLLASSSIGSSVSSMTLLEQTLTEQFRQTLLEDVPVLKRVETLFAESLCARKHLIHIKQLELRQRSYEDQCIGFAAVSITTGLPMTSQKICSNFAWTKTAQFL